MVGGRPIQILKVTKNHKFKLDEKALADIVCQNSVKNLPVAVVSISGIFRKGKSFLLNFFLRYLRAEVQTFNLLPPLKLGSHVFPCVTG